MMWKRYKRRVLLAMSSQAFAQLVGLLLSTYWRPIDSRCCRTVSMLSPTTHVGLLHLLYLFNMLKDFSTLTARVFEEAGWVGRDAILMTGINAIIYILSTIPPWYLVDRWGRRVILLSGAVVVCSTGTLRLNTYLDIILDGTCTYSDWMVDVHRRPRNSKGGGHMCDYLQCGVWI